MMMILLVTRPSDIVGFGPIFYLIFLLSFCQLLSELAERNSTKTCHILESEPDLKIQVQDLEMVSLYQKGGPKLFILTFLDDFAT